MMTRVQQVSGLATAPSLANPTVYSAVWFTQTHTDTAGTFALIAYISMVIASVHQNIVIFDTSVGDAQNGLPKVSA